MDENKNRDWKAVPVYKDSPAAAREKNELDAYRASSAANTACAKAIKEAIKELDNCKINSIIRVAD